MTRHFTKYLIIGAGPTGLGAAYALRKAQKNDFLIVEKAAAAGGLASSFVDDEGFTWDIGGHVHFSHYEEYDRALFSAIPKEKWNTLPREAWVWLENRFVPYPLQHNVHFLKLRSALTSIMGMINAQKHGLYENFEEWMLGNFGKGFTEIFMHPYNKKVWAHDPKEMSYQWIGERVASPDIRKILMGLLMRRRGASWGPNASFSFPKAGGTGEIWRRIAKEMGEEKFLYGTEIISINWIKKLARTKTEEEISFDTILSTIPLTSLVPLLCPSLPDKLASETKKLKHSSTTIVGLGIRGQAPKVLGKKSWMYFPSQSIPFYRATVFSGYSNAHTPDPDSFWSLMTETSTAPSAARDTDMLIKETIETCVRHGWLRSGEDVVSVWSHHEPFGYPVPTLKRDEALATLIPALEDRGIFSRGRFGGWKYEVGNQDHSFMQGVEWARRMILGEPEETYFYPSRINTGTKRSLKN